jgi:pimeloyl-ACP methyl ester carboxylesterase
MRQLTGILCLALAIGAAGARADIYEEAERGFAQNGDVRIHYATVGKGPLVVMIHGFPDFWYSWRHQMEGLKEHFQVVAIDQRGYNHSDRPEGVEQYAMKNLVADVAAVVRHFNRDKAVIVGHDWGGSVAWNFAFAHPEMVDKLIILNLPHPNGLAQVAADNAEARANTNYAQVFRNGSPTDPDIFFGGPMNPQTLSGWVSDQSARKYYIEAFGRSDFDAMLAYYKMNYPAAPEPGKVATDSPVAGSSAPLLDMQVLIFHGLKDTALHSDALNNTWDWIEQDVTIVSAPEAGHFVQQDASELVTSTMKWWLLARE